MHIGFVLLVTRMDTAVVDFMNSLPHHNMSVLNKNPHNYHEQKPKVCGKTVKNVVVLAEHIQNCVIHP